ncbi:hypothetical protein QE152_g33437 [Popillia japonica]|uniref:Uncharacterized protein n=1 Tax=Popillia japonica TaxID=7064 RepID=A0AAW1IWV4_POPJA
MGFESVVSFLSTRIMLTLANALRTRIKAIENRLYERGIDVEIIYNEAIENRLYERGIDVEIIYNEINYLERNNSENSINLDDTTVDVGSINLDDTTVDVGSIVSMDDVNILPVIFLPEAQTNSSHILDDTSLIPAMTTSDITSEAEHCSPEPYVDASLQLSLQTTAELNNNSITNNPNQINIPTDTLEDNITSNTKTPEKAVIVSDITLLDSPFTRHLTFPNPTDQSNKKRP